MKPEVSVGSCSLVVSKYLRLAAASVRGQGLGHCLAELASECWFDLRRGTDTWLPREVDGRALPESTRAEAVQYQGASPGLVRALLARLPAAARQGVFVDYGCGKGRALLLAAEAGFTRVVGIEISAALADTCRANLRRARGRSGVVASIEVCDAASYVPPPVPVVAFLYNPFHGETLRRVARNLAAHGACEATATWVLYVNPRGLEAFLDAGFAVVDRVGRRGRTLACILQPLPVAQASASTLQPSSAARASTGSLRSP